MVPFIPLLAFLMASAPQGCLANVCEGMSFGDCTLEEDIIIEELPVNAATCRQVCLLDDTCVFWRAHTDEAIMCTIMKSDYTKDCNSFAGPASKSIEDCINVDLESCDAVKLDECTYAGERLTQLEPPIGETSSIEACQKRASVVGAANFQYLGLAEDCRLFAAMETSCNVVSAAFQTPQDCELP